MHYIMSDYSLLNSVLRNSEDLSRKSTTGSSTFASCQVCKSKPITESYYFPISYEYICQECDIKNGKTSSEVKSLYYFKVDDDVKCIQCSHKNKLCRLRYINDLLGICSSCLTHVKSQWTPKDPPRTLCPLVVNNKACDICEVSQANPKNIYVSKEVKGYICKKCDIQHGARESEPGLTYTVRDRSFFQTLLGHKTCNFCLRGDICLRKCAIVQDYLLMCDYCWKHFTK
jgi:hypothetical protein